MTRITSIAAARPTSSRPTRRGAQPRRLGLLCGMLVATALLIAARPASAQTTLLTPSFEQPTVLSVKLSGGWGEGRARQLYGYNGAQEVWWSTGEGAKMNLAIDLPLVPVDVVDSIGSKSGVVPVVALELEAATGYHLSTGGTTNDAIAGSTIQTTTRTTSYVPVTVGLNARSNFGGGLPSVYVGAGGGVYLVGLYKEEVRYTDNTPGFTRKMSPPLPFGLYGAIGFELPLGYDVETANSTVELFGEVRVTEMTSYIYNYDVVAPDGSSVKVTPADDTKALALKDVMRSASNLALTLGIKFNIH